LKISFQGWYSDERTFKMKNSVCSHRGCPFYGGVKKGTTTEVCAKFPGGVPTDRLLGYEGCWFYDEVRRKKK
jgi:hypothetical protein